MDPKDSETTPGSTMRGVGRVTRLLRRIWLSTQARAIILLYHRVTRIAADPQLLAITPEHFAEHLEHLRTSYSPISLVSLKRALEAGHIPHKAVVVTFDDGYADNAYHAKPLLERYVVPATVFVTSGYIGQRREFWWDELERLLLLPGVLPRTLRLQLNGTVFQWELGEGAHYGMDAYQQYQYWNVLENFDPSPRQAIYRSLCQLLRPLLEVERRKVLDELLAWAGTEPTERPTHRILFEEELCELLVGDLVEIGAHTVTHPVLSGLPTVAQREEIGQSKARVEEIIGRPVTSFAYPYGSLSDYTTESVAIVREAGFTCACSNFVNVVQRGTDRFQLPRVLVRDCDGKAFARKLEELFKGIF